MFPLFVAAFVGYEAFKFFRPSILSIIPGRLYSIQLKASFPSMDPALVIADLNSAGLIAIQGLSADTQDLTKWTALVKSTSSLPTVAQIGSNFMTNSPQRLTIVNLKDVGVAP